MRVQSLLLRLDHLIYETSDPRARSIYGTEIDPPKPVVVCVNIQTLLPVKGEYLDVFPFPLFSLVIVHLPFAPVPTLPPSIRLARFRFNVYSSQDSIYWRLS